MRVRLGGELVVALICAGIVALAAAMVPSDDVLALFGFEVPVVCGLRRMFGTECLGCGLTRSFVYMAHLDPIGAWRNHRLGVPLFALVAAQVPYRVCVAALGAWRARATDATKLTSSR